MLLYVHFPFCRTRCGYCGFFSQPYSEQSCREYFDFLLQEIALRANPEGEPVTSIYIGGGTPSLMGPDRLEILMDTLADSFAIAAEPEVTLEANPESALKTPILQQARRIGVTRLSLGVQSLDNAALARLGRIHSREEAVRTFHLARDCGFSNISLDLIWALPGQTLPAWLRTLNEAIRLGPEHLSCYGLTIEPDTPFGSAFEAGSLHLPSEGVQARMFLEGSRMLREHGFLHYEISNFGRTGFFCRHNLGYWSGEQYLGFGPGAVSTLKNRRWENPRDLMAYGSWAKGHTVDRDEEVLDSSTLLSEWVMLGLRTAKGLSLQEYFERSGTDFLEKHQRMITVLLHQKLIVIDREYIRLTTEGMLVSNAVISSFL